MRSKDDVPEEKGAKQLIPGYGYVESEVLLCWYCTLPLEAPFLLSIVPIGFGRVRYNIPLHPQCNGLYRAEQQAKTLSYLSLFLGFLGLSIGLISLIH